MSVGYIENNYQYLSICILEKNKKRVVYLNVLLHSMDIYIYMLCVIANNFCFEFFQNNFY